jgi:hypothetical protein
MQFVLTGFSHDLGFRVFAFERLGDDRIRTKCTVKADLGLLKTYGIHIQELPLLCRGLLDRSTEPVETSSLVFGEEDMRAWARDRALARDGAAKRKKPPHKPTGENLGAAWRGPQHT